MRLKLTAIALLLLLSDFAFSQQSFVQTINLDTSITKTIDSASFYVKNPSSKVMHVTNGRTLNSMFYLRSTSFNVNPFDSAMVWVLFKTTQNITYNDFIIYDNDVYKNSIVFYTIATGKYADVLYAFTQGLTDENLKTALRTNLLRAANCKLQSRRSRKIILLPPRLQICFQCFLLNPVRLILQRTLMEE